MPKVKSILYVAISQGHLSVFHRPFLRWLRENGYEVHVAARESPGFVLAEMDQYHRIDFARFPFHPANLRAFVRLVKLLRARSYTLVHCHTPVASALTRLAAPLARGRPVVLYTAHGFHFFPGASLLNWVLWFSLEWVLARLTDFLVVINSWDARAARRWLRARAVRLIPGMGVDLKHFRPASERERLAQRRELGIPDDAFVLIYVAEFIPRKNHAFLIRSLGALGGEFAHWRLLLAGDGPLIEPVLAECERVGLSDHVMYLGFRKDLNAIAAAADVAVSASRHEGLPMGIAEMMACGLPVVVSEDRGHRELVEHEVSGFVYPQGDQGQFLQAVLRLGRDPALRTAMGAAARESMGRFSLGEALDAMASVYAEAQRVAEERVQQS